MRRMNSAVLAVVTATAALSLASASPAAAAPCGFYFSGALAKYNHCKQGKVKIHVDKLWPLSDQDYCVGPGITGVGALPGTVYAYATGRC